MPYFFRTALARPASSVSISSARSTLFSRVIWLSASRISLFITFLPLTHGGPIAHPRPRIDDQTRGADGVPFEPPFASFVIAESDASLPAGAQLALEMSPALDQLVQRHRDALTGKSLDRLLRAQGPVETR